MRPLLVGEANPYQTDSVQAQRYALYPEPEHSAGGRLCHKVMGLSEMEYLRSFDRVNLCDGKWSMREARAKAREIFRPDRTFVLFGAKVAAAFSKATCGIPFEPFSLWLASPTGHRRNDSGEWSYLTTGYSGAWAQVVVLPHPSGLSRAWNEPGAFERARDVLRRAGVLPC